MLAEINEIPQRAVEFLKLSPDYSLPLNVQYLGMGSSWFAPLAFKYRALKLNEMIVASGAHVITVEEPEIEENFSVIHNMVPFNYMAYYLAEKLNITETFVIGGKVTEVK